MSTISELSLNCRARAAGFFWLGTIVAGTVSLVGAARYGLAANLIADVCYVAASLLVYGLLAPVNRTLSLVAAASGIIGITLGLLAMSLGVSALAQIAFFFFGAQCVLIGSLIVQSTFLPRLVGQLMTIGGIGWLTLALANLLSPATAAALSPWILFPGIIGESSLTIWLLVRGVRTERWQEQALGRARTPASVGVAIALLLAASPAGAAAQKTDGKTDTVAITQAHHEHEHETDDDSGLDFGLSVSSNYNRVEGLPLMFGPIVRTEGPNRLELSAQVIWRTEPSASLDDDMGYQFRIDQGLFADRVRIGGDVVSRARPIETQSLNSTEPGLAALLFHTDLHDYYEERAWGLHAELQPVDLPIDARVAFRRAENEPVTVSDPWSLFDNGDAWRLQPLVAQGSVSTLALRIALDTRDDEEAAERGVFASFGVEHALDQDLAMPAADFGGVPTGGETFADFTLAHVDLRAHRPVTETSALSARLFSAGSVDETVLAPQYQRALGGIGTLPGYALFDGACGSRAVSVSPLSGDGAVSSEAMLASYGCDRVLLGQIEYRGTFGRHSPDDGVHYHGRWKFEGEMTPPQWAFFVDAGKGWAFGDLGLADRADTRTLVDAGIGLLCGGAGVYAAVPLAGEERDLRIVVRLQRRF